MIIKDAFLSSGMVCPACGAERMHVVDSRSNVERTVIRRRRACSGCGHRVSTWEVDISSFDETAASRREERYNRLRNVAVSALQQLAALAPPEEPADEPQESDKCA